MKISANQSFSQNTSINYSKSKTKENSIKFSGVKTDKDKRTDGIKSTAINNKREDSFENKQIAAYKKEINLVKANVDMSDEDKKKLIEIIEEKIKLVEEEKIKKEIEEMQRAMAEQLQKLKDSQKKVKEDNKEQTDYSDTDMKKIIEIASAFDKVDAYKKSASRIKAEKSQLEIEINSENNQGFIGKFKADHYASLSSAATSLDNSSVSEFNNISIITEEWKEEKIEELKHKEEVEEEKVADLEKEEVEKKNGIKKEENLIEDIIKDENNNKIDDNDPSPKKTPQL